MVNASIARSRRRARERGAAVFIVVLVITMLMAIGLFAANVATLSTIATGHERRMTQTHYLTEYAMQLALAEIEQNGGLDAIAPTASTNCSISTEPCWAFYPHTFDAAEDLVELPAPEAPGSLGRADVAWIAKVEITDKIKPAIGNRAGSDQGGPNAVSADYCTVTMNARLIAWPNGAVMAETGSQESLSVVADILCSK
ncbi:hypothetical protein WMF20_11555 [Sorangium sp. So ce834]|uniref:hypothetical protein n=1 Tax=Sorangium sp. So ce834 TaxID=3133321 RepID=UPI003F605E74